MSSVAVSPAASPRRASLFLYITASLGVAVAWLALVAAMLGRHGWLFELCSHFRVHYAALFLVLGVVLGALRRMLPALLAAAGFAVSAAPLAPYVQPVGSHAAGASESFRLVTFNVLYWNNDARRIAHYLEETDADAIILQELHPEVAARLTELLASYPYTHIDPDWRGAAMFSRWPITAADLPLLAQHASRGAYARLDWRGRSIALVGVHLHWPMAPRQAQLRDEQLSVLASRARAEPLPLIVAGDFNATPWSPRFVDFVDRSGLRDALLGRGLAASWPSPFTLIGIRIDHVLVSPQWRVRETHFGPHVGSDHRPLVVELELTDEPETAMKGSE